MKRMNFVILTLALCAAMIGLSGGLAYAQNGNVWHIEYYPNLDWSGAPVFTQDVTGLNLNWNSGSPGPGVPAENFTARMTTSASFTPGVYRFSIVADDEVVFLVDGSAVLDTRSQGLVGQNQFIDVAMTAGTHQLEVDYRQFTQADYVSVGWGLLPGPLPLAGPVTLPETGAAIPQAPSSATGVVTPFGDYSRCIAQGLHQSNCFVPNAENSPNLGSIQMEPQIQIWANCTANQVTTFLTGPNDTPQQWVCSKTEAGWFPQ
jgi:hypothetical protein